MGGGWMRSRNGRPHRSNGRRASLDRPPRLRPRPAEDPDRAHVSSPTAVAAELLRSGVVPLSLRRRPSEIPHQDETLCAGDPDDSGLRNEYVGEDVPGASTPTPDQNDVDEIGRAYGLQEEDAGSLRSSAEILARRDRHRSELRPPRRPRV